MAKKSKDKVEDLIRSWCQDKELDPAGYIEEYRKLKKKKSSLIAREIVASMITEDSASGAQEATVVPLSIMKGEKKNWDDDEKKYTRTEQVRAVVACKVGDEDPGFGIMVGKGKGMSKLGKMKVGRSYSVKGTIMQSTDEMTDAEYITVVVDDSTVIKKSSDTIENPSSVLDNLEITNIAEITEMEPSRAFIGAYKGMVAGNITRFGRHVILLRDSSVEPTDDPNHIEAEVYDEGDIPEKYSDVVVVGYIVNKDVPTISPWGIFRASSDDDEDEEDEEEEEPEEEEDFEEVEDEEDVEDDEDEEEEEEEDEEKPKSKKGRKKGKEKKYRAEDCALFGEGWDEDSDECMECKKKDPKGYMKCKKMSTA
ncbi:hypothetical protein B6U83_01075 [Thermoplasmatales archaeon ex4484_36]|nr:MAG: hypothetical protein B6U83_01075 [Thermoplasmatales archaeon ex4484_36]